MSFPHNFLLGSNALIIPLQSGFQYTYRVVQPSPPPFFRHLCLSWVSRVSGSWDLVKEMLFVADLSHFISCRKVHILGSFQNIKMARTALCNLILGNSSFFLWCFLWKKRTGNWGTQITFADHFRVRVMIKVASRNLLGGWQMWAQRESRNIFAWIPSANPRDRVYWMTLLTSSLRPLMRCSREPFQDSSSVVAGSAKRELLGSVSHLNRPT